MSAATSGVTRGDLLTAVRHAYREPPPFISLRVISPATAKHKVPAAARINGSVRFDVSSGQEISCAPIEGPLCRSPGNPQSVCDRGETR